jgi:membrane-associated protease RseP (regulator of RpoE activity)
VAALLVVLPLSSSAAEGHRRAAAFEAIRAEVLQRHIDYLASNELQGREAGTKGGRAAAEYLARYYAACKLKPGGADGGYFQPFEPNNRNVLAVLPGSDPELADQYVIVGAHYDHVGLGTSRNSRGQPGLIHPGADDNASGTSALLMLAEAVTFLPQSPRRSILWISFDAEEKGLFGSKHWVAHPTVPLKSVVAMIDLDMVGRLRNDKLIIHGWRTGAGWRRTVSLQNGAPSLALEFPLPLIEHADHYSFFRQGLPVLMFNTGLHDEYHTQRDKPQTINSAGLERVTRLLLALTCELADTDAPPKFRNAAQREGAEATPRPRQTLELPDRLGARFVEQGKAPDGVRVAWVLANSAARKADLRTGDRLLEVAGRVIRSRDDLEGALCCAESPAVAVVRRSGIATPVEMQFDLSGKPLRIGMKWQTDEAEPGTLILTQVVPGTPAAEAGLRAGDRIYQLDGHDFADEAAFTARVREAEDGCELLIERDGRLRSVTVQFRGARVIKRAA